GLISDVVPALKVDGRFVANPTVETARMVDEFGRTVFGKQRTGEALKAGQDLQRRGSMDLSLLDERVEAMCTRFLYMFPDCTTKTLEELRKPKLDSWNRNKENSRAWLALNMMTEARAGFRAFNEGNKDVGREVDFIALRQALADNAPWTDKLTDRIQPGALGK
ncbi:MAG: 6-oxocyclohex-1-ene-1-carbonyl-CoA hydratase, partial [Proteobacteria bacterium]|nr:6-oxocyclohex-1-ene-1-carbonyl-CoA hydratase [Pseudomonadota bacterium]